MGTGIVLLHRLNVPNANKCAAHVQIHTVEPHTQVRLLLLYTDKRSTSHRKIPGQELNVGGVELRGRYPAPFGYMKQDARRRLDVVGAKLFCRLRGDLQRSARRNVQNGPRLRCRGHPGDTSPD